MRPPRSYPAPTRPRRSTDQLPCGEVLGELELTFLHRYIWRSEVESELVSTYRCESEGPFELHPDEIEEGRFFSQDELRRLAGTGALTPNLEHELILLGILLTA